MSQFSRIVRGGVVIGLLTMASGSVVLTTAGVPFDPAFQILAGVMGIAMGGFLGARESV